MSAIMFALLLQGAPGAPAPHVVTSPEWERRPSARELTNAYPPGAVFMNRAGRATMTCTVTAEGALTGCSVVEEYPLDAGFGDAVLRIAPKFKMKPVAPDGRPVAGGTIRIPVRFEIPSGGADLYTASLICYGHVAALADRDPAATDAWNAAHAWAGQLIGMTFKSGGKLEALEASMSMARRNVVADTNTGSRDRTTRDCINVVKRAAPKAG